MATLYITEYKEAAVQHGQVVQVGQEPALAIQTVSFTTSTPSAAFNDDTTFVRIRADAAAHVRFGTTAPTATTSHTPISADEAEYFGVKGGQFVAAVAA